MKRTYSILGLAGICMVLAAACGKKFVKPQDADPGVGVIQAGGGTLPNVGGQLNKLFKDLRSIPETHCVTAGILQVIQFRKGTILTFHANSFKDKAGKIITSGTVCLEVTEMYRPGHMIANRATTMADKGMLQSSGQVYIKATKDGEEVYANTYEIAFKQQGPPMRMQLFYGNANNEDSIVEWKIADTTQPGTIDTPSNYAPILTPTPTNPTPSTITPEPMYRFSNCIKFGMINADVFYSFRSDKTAPFYINLPDNTYKSENTQIYVIAPIANSTVWARNRNSKNSLKYQVGEDLPSTYYHLPTGIEVTVVVMSKKGDKYYYFEQTGITVTEDVSVNAMPEERSLEFIKTRLSEL